MTDTDGEETTAATECRCDCVNCVTGNHADCYYKPGSCPMKAALVERGRVVTANEEEPKLCTTNGRPVDEVRAGQTNATGQHEGYIVLCPDERAKGFVRPYRDRYRHTGPNICGLHVGPDGATVCYMEPKHDGDCGVATGPRPQACGTVTTMGRALSETYARDPSFYGATFCCGCNRHLPVSEFVWTADGQVVGS